VILDHPINIKSTALALSLTRIGTSQLKAATSASQTPLVKIDFKFEIQITEFVLIL
jgi:hypothetical protein